MALNLFELWDFVPNEPHEDCEHDWSSITYSRGGYDTECLRCGATCGSASYEFVLRYLREGNIQHKVTAHG